MISSFLHRTVSLAEHTYRNDFADFMVHCNADHDGPTWKCEVEMGLGALTPQGNYAVYFDAVLNSFYYISKVGLCNTYVRDAIVSMRLTATA